MIIVNLNQKKTFINFCSEHNYLQLHAGTFFNKQDITIIYKTSI